MSPAEKLRDLSSQVGRLSVDRRDPERFFVERSEVQAELRRLAGELESRRERHGEVAI